MRSLTEVIELQLLNMLSIDITLETSHDLKLYRFRKYVQPKKVAVKSVTLDVSKNNMSMSDNSVQFWNIALMVVRFEVLLLKNFTRFNLVGLLNIEAMECTSDKSQLQNSTVSSERQLLNKNCNVRTPLNVQFTNDTLRIRMCEKTKL